MRMVKGQRRKRGKGSGGRVSRYLVRRMVKGQRRKRGKGSYQAGQDGQSGGAGRSSSGHGQLASGEGRNPAHGGEPRMKSRRARPTDSSSSRRDGPAVRPQYPPHAPDARRVKRSASPLEAHQGRQGWRWWWWVGRLSLPPSLFQAHDDTVGSCVATLYKSTYARGPTLRGGTIGRHRQVRCNR